MEHTSQLCLSWSSGDFFLVAQETGVAGLAGGFCPGEIELAGSEVLFIPWEVSSDRHLDDVEGFAIGSSGFLGRASRSLLKRSFWVMVSSSIVA